MTDEIVDSMACLNLGLRCCKQTLLPTSDGRFICSDCLSVWKNNTGKWNNNVLFCCNSIVTSHNPFPDDAAFYCRECNLPRQVCSVCNEMFHTNHNFYHHICEECFCRECEKDKPVVTTPLL